LHSIYNNTFSVYLGSHASKRWRPLVKLGDYVKALHLPTTKVFDAAWVDTPAPKVFPVEDQAYLVSPHDRYVFPPVYVAELGEALIYGGTNLVFVQGAVICHDLYDFERDYTSEELHGRHIIDEKKMRMRLLRHDATPEKIAVAATFVDACAPNYAHWLTEVLPRIVLFCAEERFVNVPIVVNDGLHKNIMEALFLVTGSKRHIITLPIGRAIKVDVMYLTSVAGYVPFERRKKELSSHSHGLFSPGSFEFLCNHMSGLGGTTEVEAWPEKIYLRRNSGARKVTNAFEIEKLLCARGYVIVEPEKLTFSQQVQLFSNAKTIVGSSGAALANILFAPQGAKIFILISKFPDTSYWYWQNMACASGKTVSYILGEVAARDHSGIHADFTVNLQHVLQELGEKS
jgi:capsular polysaccharide biosynthesis protein